MTTWLTDKSAVVRLAGSPESSQWVERRDRGLVRIATVTLLEVGFSAGSGADLRAATRQVPVAAMPREHLTPAVEDRALDVQLALAERGLHRSPPVPDLLSPLLPSWAGWWSCIWTRTSS